MKPHRPTPDSDFSQQQSVPRVPSASEKAELLSLLLQSAKSEQFGVDEEEIANAKALIDSAFIAVYDTYTSECKSGFIGKLMAVVWTTDPADHDVFVWRNGTIEDAK